MTEDRSVAYQLEHYAADLQFKMWINSSDQVCSCDLSFSRYVSGVPGAEAKQTTYSVKM